MAELVQVADDIDAASVTRATQLVLRERQSRDRGWFPRMHDCYWDDAEVRLTWFNGLGHDFVDASAAMARAGNRNTHALGALTVQTHGCRYLVEAPAAITFYGKTSGLAKSVAWTRLVYRAEQRQDDLRIRSLDVVYEREEPARPIDPTLPTAHRPYANAAAQLTQQGYTVDPELLGEDRPDDVEQFYSSLLTWLHD